MLALMGFRPAREQSQSSDLHDSRPPGRAAAAPKRRPHNRAGKNLRGIESTRVTFCYRLNDTENPAGDRKNDDVFRSLRGIAKDTFRRLGGGEAFIRNERKLFHRGGEPR